MTLSLIHISFQFTLTFRLLISSAIRPVSYTHLILDFKEQSEQLLKEYGYDAKNHYQNENSISTYLWLMYPDKYYIYKFGEIKSCAEVLKSSYKFKKGAYADNLRTFYSFYDCLLYTSRCV